MGESRSELDRHRVLAAADALQTFTIETLQRYAQVSRDAADNVLSREKSFFEVVEETQASRERPIKRYRVVPSKATELQSQLHSVWR